MQPCVSLGQLILCNFNGDKERSNKINRSIPLLIKSKQLSDTEKHVAALI